MVRKNAIEMYTTHNEGKSFVTEIFIRTLQNKIYNNMASISKIVYTDKLDDTVNKCNNTYHEKIKMNPADVKSSTYADSSKKLMIKLLNLKSVILLGYQNIKTFSQKILFLIGLKKFCD